MVRAAGVMGAVMLAPWCRAADPPEGPPIPLTPQDAHRPEVYLNDSFEAADSLLRAKRMLARGDGTAAAELLIDVSHRFGDKLIQVDHGAYVGLRRHIQDLIGGWPQPAQRVYQSLAQRELDHALESLSRRLDPYDLVLLFDEFFCSDGAAQLADTIGQLALEKGDIPLALYVYQRVVTDHPNRQRFRRRYENALAVLHAILGQTKAIPDDVMRRADDGRIIWLGREQSLSDVLSAVARDFDTGRHAPAETDWPLFAGSVERNRPSHFSIEELGLQWRVDLASTDWPVSAEAPDDDEAGIQDGRDRTIHPVVVDDVVYVQRFREVLAVQRESGVILWRNQPEDMPVEIASYVEDQPAGWDAVTVADGRVYAVLPGPRTPYYGYGESRTPHEVVSLDAATGKPLWRQRGNAFDDQFSEVHFDSSPVVQNGMLYVVGRRKRSFAFEDCYLFRFDADNGRFRSRTHLGSAAAGSFGTQAATRSVAAMHAGTLYVCTNIGTIGAVRASSGSVRWLRTYLRDGLNDEQETPRGSLDVMPWHFNPVLYADGRIVAMPMDSLSVLVLDAADGRVLNRLSRRDLGNARTLMGLHGTRLYTIGDSACCYDLSNGMVIFSTALAEGDTPAGRGVWTSERLLVPTASGLVGIATDTGTKNLLPWDTAGRGGNMVAIRGQMLVADAGTLSSYLRKADIWASLRAKAAAAPGDPAPAMDLAEVALRSGQLDESVQALNTAVDRFTQAKQQHTRALETRMFEHSVALAKALADAADPDRSTLDHLFDYAERFAVNEALHLRFRTGFATIYERIHDPGLAMRLYQQILRDRSLRDIIMEPPIAGVPRAGSYAEAQIADLIERYGRALYAPIEEEARRRLEAGTNVHDKKMLVGVVDAFPNSLAAPRALVEAAHIAVRSGRPDEAAQFFTQAFQRYPHAVDRPALLQAIGLAYEGAGRRARAYLWLRKALLEHPSSVIEMEGQSIPLGVYLNRLRDVRRRVEPTRAHMELPIQREFVHRFSNQATLLEPRFARHPQNRWSRFLVYEEDQGIRAFASADGTKLWQRPAPVRAKPELLLGGEDTVLLGTPHEVFALDAVTGNRLWSHGRYPANFAAPDADWEDGHPFRSHMLHGNRLVSYRSDGTISCLDVSTGRLLWDESDWPVPHGDLYVGDRLLAYPAMQDGRVVVCMAEVATGKWVDAILTNEHRPVERTLITLDGQVILITSQSIASYDPVLQRSRWRRDFRGHIQVASLLLDLDAVYVFGSSDAIQKISLDDGRVLWTNDHVARRGDTGWTVEREQSSLIASTSGSIVAVDPVNGGVLWRGATPEDPRFIARPLTDAYAIAVDASERIGVAYFYDHRNASGVIAEGGAPRLGHLEDVQHVLAVDGALLIQDGSHEIRGIMGAGDEP